MDFRCTAACPISWLRSGVSTFASGWLEQIYTSILVLVWVDDSQVRTTLAASYQ